MTTAKNGLKNPEGIPNPELQSNIEVGINKYSGVKQEKEFVEITSNDSYHLDKYKRLWIVNGKEYSSLQYSLKLVETKTNPTPKRKPKAITPLDSELKALTLMDRLKKKVNTLNKQYNAYETAELHKDKDTQYLKGKAIKKSRCIISKYLKQLRQDTNFKLSLVGETVYKMVYSGKYVNVTKRGNILVKGVF